MPLNTDKLQDQLILEEGLRLMAYDDATGYPVPAGKTCKGNLTVGVGHNLDAKPLTEREMSFVGHDGRSKPITHDNAIMILEDDITDVVAALNNNLPWWNGLDEIRARALADMAFNMGMHELMQFKTFNGFMRSGAYQAAADDLKRTPWYDETGTRGVRIEGMIRTGEDYTA